MNAVKARFDGKKVVLPTDFKPPAPGDVIVVFESNDMADVSSDVFLKAQEESFAKVWDNTEDEVYDAL
jgi:hypothetical protein